ncbi:MAG: hypothetical protein ABI575_02135 [Oxalobacteraceae bacterium]
MLAGIDPIVLLKALRPMAGADAIQNLTFHSTDEASGLPESVKIAACTAHLYLL